MKRFRKNIIILIFVCVLVLYLVLKDDFNGITNLIINSNKMYIIIAILFMLISDVFKGISVSELIKNSGFNYKYKDGFMLMLMTNFFNGVTPFSLGGQPFELYIMKKDNDVDYISGTNILFKDYYTYQMAVMFLSTLCIALNYIFGIALCSQLVLNLIWIGYIINLAITIFLVYIPYSKKEKYKIVEIVIKILNKIGIVKDKDSSINNTNNWISDFKKKTREVISDMKIIVKCSILNVFKLIAVCISTYFCFIAIGSSVPLYSTIVGTILVIIMASFVPIPGASGGMEFSFMQVFSYFVIDSKLGAAMLMWRFITYYLPMIYGSVLLLIKRSTT